MGFNKKVLSKAVSELGKAKAPGKPKDIITDPAGQWKYPGQKTRIPGNDITMQGVPYPVWAQPNVGPGSMMQPNQDYNFPGASYVDETPMAKKGGSKLGTINLNPNPLSHYELNYGFNLPAKENGGEADYEDLDLTDEEIQAYRDGGYVVEELPEAQDGGPQNTSGPRNKVEPEAIPVGDPWSPDYDLRRFTAEDPMGFEAFSHGKGHATDQYKLPNHPTFSDHTNWADGSVSHGSLYSNTENPGGEWVQKQDGSWNFNTSHANRSNMSDEDLKWYFENVEPGNTLNNNPVKKQGGFVQHELVKAQYGEEFDYDYDKYKTAYYKSNTPNEEGEMPNTQVLPEVTVKPENLPDWLKHKLNYDKVNPYDQYLAKRHNEYKKTINKKFANSLGLNPDALPESKEKEFKSDYENLRNSYITKSLGKQKGFNPNRHREWVDQLSPKEREIVSQSTYGENLQPSYWARGLAGAQELVNAGVKATGVPALLYGDPNKDVLNYKTPGLTNKEWNEIHTSGTGALETAAPLDIPGVAIANYLKNTNRDQPNIFSGKPMANVSQGDAAALNPFLLTGVGEMMAGKSLLGVGANSLKSGAKSVGTALGQEQLMNNLSKSKNINQVVGSIKGVPPESALARLSPEELKAYRQVQEVSRMRATGKPVSQQYQWALDQGIPEEHLSKMFNKSKSEIKSEIPLLKEREKSVEAIKEKANQTRIDRTNELSNTTGTSGDDVIRHTLVDDEIDNGFVPEQVYEPTTPIRSVIDRNAVSRNFNKNKKKTGLIDAFKSKVDKGLTSLMSEYPYYTGSVKENVPSLALNDKTSLKNVHNIVSNDSTVGVNAGDVFTGSLDTSHSSYLPQLKQTFKYNEGKPQFLGYKNMNNSGFLSGSRYSSDDIAKYLNTEIDEQIKRGIIPANIQRPYAKDNSRILLPHYGIKQGSNPVSKTIGAAEDVRNANGTLNLNAGISPQLIKNFVGPKNKVLANIVDKGYISPFLSKAFNKYNPLNLSGVGEKLEGAVRPLSNVLGNSIKNNKLTGGKSLFGKAKPLSTQIGKTDASKIYAARFDDTAEGSNIRLGEANPQGRFSRKSNATFPIETKAGVNRYDVPISDPGVELFRKYPFMNRYAKINKQKLMNNEFQWSTTGAGLQNVAEKYGKGVVGSTLGYGAYNAYNFDKNKPETFATPEEIELVNEYNNGQFAESDVPSRAEMFKRGAKEAYESPLDYAKNPYFVNDIYQGLKPTPEEKNGGSIESWEDDLDEEEIRLLKEAGFIVEELK